MALVAKVSARSCAGGEFNSRTDNGDVPALSPLGLRLRRAYGAMGRRACAGFRS